MQHIVLEQLCSQCVDQRLQLRAAFADPLRQGRAPRSAARPARRCVPACRAAGDRGTWRPAPGPAAPCWDALVDDVRRHRRLNQRLAVGTDLGHLLALTSAIGCGPVSPVRRRPMSRLTRRFAPTTTARAHCDLPCGVYDPEQARIEAELVDRINEKYAANEDTAFRTRAVAIKEERAGAAKDPPRRVVARLLQARAPREGPQPPRSVLERDPVTTSGPRPATPRAPPRPRPRRPRAGAPSAPARTSTRRGRVEARGAAHRSALTAGRE